jgi:hypothetical protein
MPDASDEQTWWSDLFTGGADPGLEIPDGVWESVVATTFEIETPQSTDDLLPADHVSAEFGEPEVDWGVHYDIDRHSDSCYTTLGDDGDSAIAEEHHSLGHEVPYDASPDDSPFGSDDAINNDF